LKWPLALMKEAEMDGYVYFDINIRPLPKKVDGSIDTAMPGFHDNDVDAFRHAYVSGIFVLEYGQRAALLLGWMNEFVFPSPIPDRNMDLWNNAVGRALAKNNKTKESLASAIKDALQSGELITSPNDERSYQGVLLPRPDGLKSVVVLKTCKSGSNEVFFDLQTSKVMSRSEFVTAINNGQYPGYEIRKMNGINIPVSKRDDLDANNLG
jgi:hypothetical protein